MRLADLDARFVRYETRYEHWEVCEGDPATWRARGCPTKTVEGPREYSVVVETLADAQGIRFLCPLCFAKNNGMVGTHEIEVTFEGRGATDKQGSHNKSGAAVRWNVQGTGLDDLTLRPSILSEGECGYHGYVTGGSAD